MFDFSSYLFSPLAYIVLFTLAVSSVVVFDSFRNYSRRTYRYFSLYAVLTWLLVAAYLMQSMSTVKDNAMFWANVKVTASTFIPTAWLWVSSLITRHKMPPKWVNFLIILIGMISAIVLWNDSSLKLFRTSVDFIKMPDGTFMLKPVFGIWFYTVYSWGIIFLQTVLAVIMYGSAFVNSYKSGKILHGLQIALILFGIFGGMPFVMKLTYIDSYVISSVCILIIQGVLLNRFRFLDVVPMAKDTVMDMINSGVFIFDGDGILMDTNKCGRSFFNAGGNGKVSMGDFCRHFGIERESFANGVVHIFKSSGGGQEKIFSAKMIPVVENDTENSGCIVYMSDLTEQTEYFNLRSEQEKIEQKRLILNDIHDSISGSVSVIGMISSKDFGDIGSAADGLRSINRIANEASGEIRFLMNSCDRNNPVFHELCGDMRYLGNLFTEGSLIRFDFFEKASTAAEYPVPFNIYLNIVRFYKECIVNAIKHSGANEIFAEAEISGDTLRVTVKDNGNGELCERGTGRGLRSMKKRMAAIDGTLEISSGADGTVITAFVPLVSDESI
ncbi:histidine kinase N-terminal 7TM domain-containing protein [Seleniivibrio woodruffii]|uniref:sensor histidine kinase n=1 Tax=Seleniivibrio woodruffii TaxID=1078050 RepID=UPI0026EFA7AB|nr:histidine kinase N-terminal 7TM domain-containing protein [Seleniivibrio woodruffii]